MNKHIFAVIIICFISCTNTTATKTSHALKTKLFIMEFIKKKFELADQSDNHVDLFLKAAIKAPALRKKFKDYAEGVINLIKAADVEELVDFTATVGYFPKTSGEEDIKTYKEYNLL